MLLLCVGVSVRARILNFTLVLGQNQRVRKYGFLKDLLLFLIFYLIYYYLLIINYWRVIAHWGVE